MSCTKPMTSAQNTKTFIEKIVSNTNIAQSYNQKSSFLNVSKKKFSLDHSNAATKENFSNKSLNYFISPRSSSEQIFKNIKNMASSSKNNTVLSPKPLLNNSNSINKDISQDKENNFLKYLKENNNYGKNKLLSSTEKNDDNQKKDKNTAEIIESLESLKNKYKTLKEMNFLKCNKTGESSEMICASKFSKITNNSNCNRLRNNLKENNGSGIQNNENSTNNTINENSKKSNGTKKNNSGNMSNILSTNSNSDGEIHQISNEKDQKINKNNHEKTLFTEIFNKNLSLYPLNKEKMMKVFQNLAKKHNGNQKNNTVFSRNLSIPENNTQIFEGKKQIERRNSLHCEPEKDQTTIPEKFICILKKTKKIMDSYKMKELKWKKEEKVLHSQIDELKKRLSFYEVI